MPRKTKQPIDRSALLQSCAGSLAKIAAKTNFLTQLSSIVRQICPDIPVEAYQIANFHQSAIIIEVKSSIWSQRLQFERVKISQQLAELSQGQFTKIEIKVNPYYARAVMNEEEDDNVVHRYHRISTEAAEHIEKLAQTAPQGLKEKLQRLAKLANKKS
jgi:hypothetical protein